VIRSATRAGLLVLAGALTVSGCALTFDATDLGVPTSMAESARTPAQGEAFRITKKPVFLLWGLIGTSRPNAENILAGQVGTGSRVANLKIKLRMRLTDLIVTGLTLGLVNPRTVTFEGVVVPAGNPSTPD
jgi:hypothetical protein